jgi:ABC-type uncharacterized transport system permease subunit
MNILTLMITAALFLTAAVTILLCLYAPPKSDSSFYIRPGILPLLIAAGTSNTLTVICGLILPSHPALHLTGFVMATTLVWLSTVGYLFLRSRIPVSLMTASATLILLYLVMRPASTTEGIAPLVGGTPLKGYGHIAIGIIGESFAIYAAAVALLYLTHQRLLKRKLLARMHPATPTIIHLEKMLHLTLWAGFICITLALISGVVVSLTSSGLSVPILKRKIVWALCVWLWYLGTLIGHRLMKFTTKRTAAMTLFGFIILSASFFGIAFGGLGR